MADSRGRTLGVLLFPAFELLDVFGPLQAFGNIRLGDDRWRMVTVAERAGAVESAQGPRAVADATPGECPRLAVLRALRRASLDGTRSLRQLPTR
ncbi:MAG: hypothetical protein E6J70_04945 [Deltaproteobacteria bacterium]|nr:MAG: hypothetical protein E6J70_04945 [Deltaproteobacteria bacterium]